MPGLRHWKAIPPVPHVAAVGDNPTQPLQRLALFAATHDGVATDGEWVEWLLKDGACWLWSVETYRETMRLLVLRGAELEAQPLGRLQAGILAGPARHGGGQRL